MNQPVYQQLDPKAIEALKAARNQVIQGPTPRQAPRQISTAAVNSPEVNPVRKGEVVVGLSNGVKNKQEVKFVEEFIQKLASLEQETAAIDEEIAKMEKIWQNLTEKKKQLENRRNELIKVRDKITTLNKEMDDVLSS